jgi:hypothetical protein
MDRNDIVSNSHRAKTQATLPEKKIEKVIKGTAKTKKKTEISKFKDVFIAEDAKNVKSYIVMDVLIPAAKKAVSDIVTNGIDMILYGETGRTKKRTASSGISYRDYYSKKDDRDYRSTTRTRTGYNYDDIVLETRVEAEEVLTRMDEIMDLYGLVTVADLHDLVGITGNYTDQRYGWTNIRSAEAVRVRDGYLLKLPKALPIN